MGGNLISCQTSPRSFFAKAGSISLLAALAALLIARPENLPVFTQLSLMILIQIPLHELAHYLAAKRYFDANWGAETRRLNPHPTSLEQEFVKWRLAPRFGLNCFYGIETLKIVPAIFLQELNYTGAQYAVIMFAGPAVDFSFAAAYIIAGLALGPRNLLGFFSTEVMWYYGVSVFLTWAGAYAARELDLGQFRYSRVKRNACNRFLMNWWYLSEAGLDEQGQLIADTHPGQGLGITRLRFLFEKAKKQALPGAEFDLLLEAVIAANPPLSKLARIGSLLQALNDGAALTGAQLSELEIELGSVEKALKVHAAAVRMKEPLYLGLGLAAMGSGISPSTMEIQNILTRLKAISGVSGQVPYFVAGGTLILCLEASQLQPGKEAVLRAKLGGSMQIRGAAKERRSFQGRRTIQVGIARMQAPEGMDYSRELAHAEVLWAMMQDAGS